MSHPTLADLTASLTTALATWASRDDTIPQADVRTAGGEAVDLIDTMLHVLHAVRGQLVGEIVESDRAAMRRTEALLAEFAARREMATAMKGA